MRRFQPTGEFGVALGLLGLALLVVVAVGLFAVLVGPLLWARLGPTSGGRPPS